MRAAAVLCALTFTILSVIAGSSEAHAQVTLIRSHYAAPDSLDPHIARGHGAANTISSDLFVGLTTVDGAGKIIPGMAERWEISPDGLTYLFHIRTGMTWSDGTPLDARDFDYSLRRVLTGGVPAPFAHYLFPIRNSRGVFAGKLPASELGIELLDEHTLRLVLEHPASYFIDVLSISVGAPVPRHAIEAHGARWTDPRHMVTNGPFLLERNVPQDHLLLRKNPRFFEQDQVQLDQVMYLIIQDRNTALRRFRAGEIDIDDAGFPGSQLSWLRRNMPDVIRIAPRRQLQYCVFNTSRPPFNDSRVRRALSLAVNREVLVNKVLRTPDMPSYRLIPPYIAHYGRAVAPDYMDKPMRQRQTQARRLLKAAGFDEANPLTLTLAYSTDADNKRISVALAAMWKSVGVVTQLLNSEPGVHLRSVAQGDYDVARLSWGAEVDDPHSFFFLLTQGSPTNHSRYRNDEFDRLVASAMNSADSVARADLFEAAERQVLKDAPILPLYFVAARNLVSPRVTGWQDTPLFIHPSRYLKLRP